MDNSIFLKKSLINIIDDLQNKKISPSDLFKEFHRLYNLNEDKVHAWACINNEYLDYILDTKEINFPTYAIPYGVKDIFNTLDMKTEMGSETWKNHNAGNDARIVDGLRRNGFIPIGKTVTAEFAVHHLNKTLNPHNLKRTPGTSSSGSAVAVATGMVPFALGTQTAGSIIRPASFCGVWGMKPSFGLIPRTGSLKTTDSLDTIGYLTTHGENLRTILNLVRVKGPNYPFIYKNIDKKKIKNKQKNIKVGIVKSYTWQYVKDYAKNAFDEYCKKFSKFNEYQLEEVKWMDSFDNIHEIHSKIYNKSLGYYFKNESKNLDKISDIMKDIILNSAKISKKEFVDALLKQEEIIIKLNQLLKKYDFVICLSTSSSAPLRDDKEIIDNSLIWTLCHSPSISAPVFRCPENLPYGLQFISSKYDDYNLLNFVEELIRKEILPTGSLKIR